MASDEIISGLQKYKNLMKKVLYDELLSLEFGLCQSLDDADNIS